MSQDTGIFHCPGAVCHRDSARGQDCGMPDLDHPGGVLPFGGPRGADKKPTA